MRGRGEELKIKGLHNMETKLNIRHQKTEIQNEILVWPKKNIEQKERTNHFI